jgi:hypothetical protein
MKDSTDYEYWAIYKTIQWLWSFRIWNFLI